jgi:hypothetical protein
MNSKMWYTSKTLWFNIISVVVVAAMTLDPKLLGPYEMQVVGEIIAVGNVILRLLTSQPLTLTSPGE